MMIKLSEKKKKIHNFFYLYKNLLQLYNKANLIEILFVLNLRAAKLKFSRVENGKMRENID